MSCFTKYLRFPKLRKVYFKVCETHTDYILTYVYLSLSYNLTLFLSFEGLIVHKRGRIEYPYGKEPSWVLKNFRGLICKTIQKEQISFFHIGLRSLLLRELLTLWGYWLTLRYSCDPWWRSLVSGCLVREHFGRRWVGDQIIRSSSVTKDAMKDSWGEDGEEYRWIRTDPRYSEGTPDALVLPRY